MAVRALFFLCFLFSMSLGFSLEKTHIRKNPHFTGRTAELKQMREMLLKEKRIALVGTAGIGKTTLAYEYVSKWFNDYDFVFWFDPKGGMIPSIRDLAGRLSIPAGRQPLSVIVAAIKQRLDIVCDRYLLVFDSMPDDPLQLSYIPAPSPRSNCHVLITSRCGKLRDEGSVIELERLKRDDSIALLQKIAAKSIGGPSNAEYLADALEDFPFALEQAGAFLANSNESVSSYVERLKLRKASCEGEEAFSGTIGSVGLIAMEELERSTPLARKVLATCSFMNGSCISIKLLGKMIHPKGGLDKTLGMLARYRLITLEGDTIVMHRFFQRTLQAALTPQERSEYLQKSLHFFNYHFNYSREELFHDKKLEVLFPHLYALFSFPFTCKKEPVLAARLLRKMGEYELWEQNHYQKALEHLSLSLKMERELLEEEEKKLAQNDSFSGAQTQIQRMKHRCGSLYFAKGTAYSRLGQRLQAKEYFTRSLELFKELKKNERANKYGCYIASSLHGLARVAYSESDYKKSQSLFQKALAVNKAFYNTEERFFIARDIHWLGCLCHKQGDFNQAIDLFKRAIEIDQKVFGMEVTPYSGATFCEMGRTYHQLNRFDEAKIFYARAIQAEEKYHGSSGTPQYATAHYRLAKLYLLLGELELAQKHLHEALLTQTTLYSTEEHPEVLSTLRLLGQLFLEKGNWRVARSYFDKVYQISRKIQGSGPPSAETGKALLHLGNAAIFHSEFAQARRYFEEALKVQQQVYNNGSLHTAARVLLSIGQIHFELGNYEDAKKHFKKAHKYTDATFATDNHTYTAAVLRGLGAVAVQQSEFAKGQKYLSQAFEIFCRLYKTDAHPDISNVLLQQAILSFKTGEYDEAADYCDRARAINSQIYNDESNIFLGEVLMWRGRIAYREGKFMFAKEMLEQGKQIMDMLFQDDPTLFRAKINHFLSDIMVSFEDYGAASTLIEKSLQEYRGVYGSVEHSNLINPYTTRAKIYIKLKEFDQARADLKQALILANKFNTKSSDYRKIGVLFWYGNLEHALGNYKQAELYFRKQYYVLSSVYKENPDHPYIGVSFMRLADCLNLQGNHQAALFYYKKGMDIQHKNGFVFQHYSVIDPLEKLQADLSLEENCLPPLPRK